MWWPPGPRGTLASISQKLFQNLLSTLDTISRNKGRINPNFGNVSTSSPVHQTAFSSSVDSIHMIQWIVLRCDAILWFTNRCGSSLSSGARASSSPASASLASPPISHPSSPSSHLRCFCIFVFHKYKWHLYLYLYLFGHLHLSLTKD